MTNQPNGPDPLRPWWRGWWGIGVFVLVGALLAGGILWLVQPESNEDRCAPGVSDLHWAGSGEQRECVGFTDEVAFAFDPGLKAITDRIAAENKRVRDQWDKPAAGKSRIPYVRIALLTPLTASDTSALPLDQIRTSLEGAFTAQCRANLCPGLADAGAVGIQGTTPLIQLLLANEGRNETHWQPVVAQLAALTGGEHPLVAVAGMGISVPETQAAADALAKLRIPAIGAILTADDLNAENLFKVSPANLDYAKALRDYLDHSPLVGHTGYLVFDSRQDNYVRSLRTSFDQQLADYIGARRASFVGTTGTRPEGVPRLFGNIVNNICLTKADVILYAGRDRDLSDLVDALSTRAQCGHDAPITILTGATGTFAQGQEARARLRTGGITLVDASATAPARWIAGKQPPIGFAPFHRSFQDLHFADTELQDGYAIMHHDAVLTAIFATRIVTDLTGKTIPDHQDVLNQITNLHDASPIPAASGRLSFDDASHGWPHDKPVPLIRFPADFDTPGQEYRTP